MNLLSPPLPQDVIQRVSWTLARLYEVIPIEAADGRLTVASGEPFFNSLKGPVGSMRAGSVKQRGKKTAGNNEGDRTGNPEETRSESHEGPACHACRHGLVSLKQLSPSPEI